MSERLAWFLLIGSSIGLVAGAVGLTISLAKLMGKA